MEFKKQNWVKYGRKGMTGQIAVFDEDKRLIDKSKWTLSDKESERKIFTIFKNKYGVFKQNNNPKESLNPMIQYEKDMGR